ncbi:uncharacterized protein LOC143842554 [Paroedura picta]|uniref:uncharacterized protein LOC143842554 n=1 Tax=Paroedura picta TaxID=143630 RepID=UPI0040573D26
MVTTDRITVPSTMFSTSKLFTTSLHNSTSAKMSSVGRPTTDISTQSGTTVTPEIPPTAGRTIPTTETKATKSPAASTHSHGIRNTTAAMWPQATTCPSPAGDAGVSRLFASMDLITSRNISDPSVGDAVVKKLEQILREKFPCTRFTVSWKGEQRR